MQPFVTKNCQCHRNQIFQNNLFTKKNSTMIKKMILGAFALGLLFAACQKEISPLVGSASAEQIMNDGNKRVVSNNNLPQTAQAILKADYPSAAIEVVYEAANGFEVELDNDFTVVFDRSGKHLDAAKGGNKGCLGGKKIKKDSLPASISAYVTANFDSASIVRAVKKADGTFAIKIKNPSKVLLFDAAGVYTGECPPPPPHTADSTHVGHDTIPHGHDSLGHHHGHNDTTHVGHDSIPHGHGGTDNDSIPHGGGGHGGGGHGGGDHGGGHGGGHGNGHH